MLNLALAQEYLRQDTVLASLIERVEPAPIPPTRGVFFDLVSCVVDQQIPHRSRGVYLKKVMDLLEGDEPTPRNVYAIREDDWSRYKLAGHKYHTLLRLADHWNEHDFEELDWDAHSDGEIKALLTAIKGIGPQTADLILLYTLQRPNVFPVNDYHLKIILAQVYDLDPEQKVAPQLLALAEKWAPYCSLATRYLLAYKELVAKK